ncbi:MAG: cbb3-type cytochrome c oxidase subunit I, partial [Gammaproteobacteria bacterium]
RVVDRPIYSLRLVKIHFWTHNIGLLGMVASFVAAGTVGGLAGMDMTADEVSSTVRPFMISVGMFGLLVLTANGIWAYNLFRTGRGWGNEHG